MGLVNITPIEDGAVASANSVNEPIGKLAAEINGNLDSSNLANEAVTRAKLAPQSVTSDKLFISKTVDDNGWTVTDYGTTKEYRKKLSGTHNLGPNTGMSLGDYDLPVGISTLDSVAMQFAYRQSSWEINYMVATQISTKLRLYAFNPSNINFSNSSWVCDVSITPGL